MEMEIKTDDHKEPTHYCLHFTSWWTKVHLSMSVLERESDACNLTLILAYPGIQAYLTYTLTP